MDELRARDVGAVRLFARALCVDLQRGILSTHFVLMALLMFAYLFVNCCFDLFLQNSLQEFGIAYVFMSSVDTPFGLDNLHLVIATAVFSDSYLIDRNSGFVRYAKERVGSTAYLLARVISVALTAFVAFAVANLVLLASLCIAGSAHNPRGMEGEYLELAMGEWPWAFYAVRIFLNGLKCSLAAVLALCVSTFLPNIYVLLVAPMLAYEVYNLVASAVARVLGENVGLMISLSVAGSSPAFDSIPFSVLWSAVYMLTLTALLARCFMHRAGKE